MQGWPRTITTVVCALLSIELALLLGLSFFGDSQISLAITSQSAYFAGAHRGSVYLARQVIIADSNSLEHHGDVTEWGRTTFSSRSTTGSVGSRRWDVPSRFLGIGWQTDRTTMDAGRN